MILCKVSTELEAVVNLEILNFQGVPQNLKVIVDTGCTGWLTLPVSVIANLGFSFEKFGRATLADGSEIAFSIYEANLRWDGRTLKIRVDAVNSEPLLGMSLMQGCKLTVEDIVGGTVSIERIGQ